ncbi:MAG: hypothetical protein HYR57_05255 [Candidatus Koribacter versatilis]|nr:hypothetical protein [Candidatus Koribacter versatilis]
MQRHIDVFEQVARMDAAKASTGFDQVVTGLAGVIAAQYVGEGKGLIELPGSHHEARAVNGPWALNVHKASSLGEGWVVASS